MFGFGKTPPAIGGPGPLLALLAAARRRMQMADVAAEHAMPVMKRHPAFGELHYSPEFLEDVLSPPSLEWMMPTGAVANPKIQALASVLGLNEKLRPSQVAEFYSFNNQMAPNASIIHSLKSPSWAEIGFDVDRAMYGEYPDSITQLMGGMSRDDLLRYITELLAENRAL